MIKRGTGPLKIDHRDFDFHKSFGTTAQPVFPPSYFTDAHLGFPDQNAEGEPFGCTNYTQSELANDLIQQKTYTPSQLEAITHANALGGYDIRASLKAALGLGWISAFFNIRPAQLDMFDSVRLAMLSGAPEQRSVSVGTPWFYIFEQPMNGVLQTPSSFDTAGASWHNHKICGWKMIGDQPYLISKSWQGSNYGDGGFCYWSRSLFNSVMAIPGTCAFTATNSKPNNVQTISLSTIQYVMSLIRNLLGYSY